jgi:beta-galactosidase
MPDFAIEGDHFALDGRPLRILSGAMHYFRVPPELWADRLLKLRAMGLNTLETYVAWNLHEPAPGQFRFSGGLDLGAYLRLAADLGLYALLRPGPYICSEWDLGGLPAWLLADPGMRLRCAHPPYLKAVDRFLDALVPHFAPQQVTQGGRLLAVQVENEYGSFGNDHAYLGHLAVGLRRRGVEVPLFTSDGPSDEMLQYGTLPGVLKTANFGSGARQAFAKLREYQPDGPLMCGEFWNGWFDHWGEEHHRRPPQDAAAALDELLAAGASVSLYMFHGGTNFGFMNGANGQHGQYQPTVTSYDDDAPLDEAGDPTPKYFALREVIGRYAPLPAAPPPEPSPKMALGPVALTQAAPLLAQLDALSVPVRRPAPEPMEALGQAYGFILYSGSVSGPRAAAPLRLRELRDRALVFVDGALRGVLEREFPERTLSLEIPADGARLDILVENMGRINYGPDLLDRKGITEGVILGQQYLYGWTIRCLPLCDLSRLRFDEVPSPAFPAFPAFWRGRFRVDGAVCDTFLALPGWRKGVAWLNGINLGRYWDRGPQRTLYVPRPFLRAGDNELVVLELHGMQQPQVEFRDRPELG